MNTSSRIYVAALTAVVSIFGSVATTRATVLVDNSFNLGVANGADLNGVAVGATGFTGNYSISNTTQNGSTATETFTSTGLTFGGNFHPVSGGAAVLTTTTPNTSNPATAGLNATISATAAGTIYSSYLTSITGSISSGNYSSASTSAGSLKTSTNVGDGLWTGDKAAIGVTGTGGSTSTVVFSPTSGTTYLVLARFTNIGTASAVSVDNLWIFDQTHYDSWFAAGANESSLDGAALKTATNTSAAGTFNLNGTFNITNGSGNTSGHTQITDEFRVGTSLSDVTAVVPEPVGTSIMSLAAMGLLGLRKRRA